MARFRSLLADEAWRRVAVVLLAAIGMQLAALTVPARAEGALFSDSFETGDLSAWSLRRGLVVQSAEVFSGAYAARMTYNGTGIETYADKTLGPGLSSVYYRLRFKIISQGPENVNLLSLGPVTVGLSSAGKLLYRHRLGTRRSAITVERSVWHTLQVHVLIAGDQSRVETFYDGAPVAALTSTESLGTTPIHKVQLGESSRGLQPYDVAFDDVAVATSFIADGPPPPSDTQPPSPPGGLTATAPRPDTIALSWTAATDDVGVAAYEIERNGSPVGSVDGAMLSFIDGSVSPATSYTYRVVARDRAGNRSPASNAVTFTTDEVASVTLNPVADTYVDASQPDRNFNAIGVNTALRTDNSPLMRSFLRFDAQGAAGAGQVLLRVYAETANATGLDLHTVADTSWSEGITYNNAPAIGPVLASSGPVTAGSWVTFDVTSAVAADGPVSFALTSPSNTAIRLSSRTGANPPQLVLRAAG